jgi:lysophospholipase L1-like esterase
MVICFIGDSLTQGIGDDLALGWVGRLAQSCFALDPSRHRGTTMCNLGVRGEASIRIAQRWRQETDRRRREGEDMAFVFSFGAADGLHKIPEADTLKASREIIGGAAALGRTLYIAPPPAFDPQWSAHIAKTGKLIGSICAECGVPSFDFHAPLAATPGYMAALERDGIHPDAAGYQRMADLLREWRPMAELIGI